MSLSKLIEAMNIFLKYGDVEYPTHCMYDTLWVLVDPGVVSPEDIEKLDELGFFASEEEPCFKSYQYGSA